MDLGDDNIKFFHRFTNHRNCINTIWEMKHYEDHNVRGFKILDATNIAKIMKVFYYFPFLVSEEDGFIKNFIPFKH